jgi:hypothetical protein
MLPLGDGYDRDTEDHPAKQIFRYRAQKADLTRCCLFLEFAFVSITQ